MHRCSGPASSSWITIFSCVFMWYKGDGVLWSLSHKALIVCVKTLLQDPVISKDLTLLDGRLLM